VGAPRNLNGRQNGAPIRPRVEDDFAYIERWRNIDDPADSLWRSIPGDNVNRRDVYLRIDYGLTQ
jgi:Salmonella virulence plasmid 65kDa B protein